MALLHLSLRSSTTKGAGLGEQVVGLFGQALHPGDVGRAELALHVVVGRLPDP